MNDENGDIIIYQTDDGLTKIDVKVQNETVWLSQQQMAELFSTSRTNVIEHINNIYLEEELDKNSTCQNFRQVRKEGNRNVTREIPFYNLDMIISLGYRIKSKVATNFRKNEQDYVSLTDIAKKVNKDEPRFVIQNWMRNKDTIDYLGLWEKIYNPNFNRVGFEAVKNEAGRNRFTMSPSKWIKSINAIGIISKYGKNEEISIEFVLQFTEEERKKLNLKSNDDTIIQRLLNINRTNRHTKQKNKNFVK